MKKKIVSVLLASVLSFCFVSVLAFGSLSLKDIFDIVFFIVDTVDDFRHSDISAYAQTSDGIKARAEVAAKFKGFRDELPADMSQADFLELLVDIMGDNDYSYISEKYGTDVADFHLEHAGELLDFKVKVIFPVFHGLDDFVNFLYTSDLDNYSVDDNGNVQMPVEDLKTELEKQNQTLTPKNRDVVKYSWRDLSDGQSNYDANQLGRLIGKNHQFLDKASYSDGVYIQYYGRVPGTAWQVPREGVFDYYSPFQYHIYLENIVEDGYYDSTGAGYPHTKYEWHCDALYYLMIDGERSYTVDTVITTFEDTMSSDTYHNAYGDFSYLNIGFMQGGNTRFPMFSNFYGNSANAHSAVSYNKSSYPDFNDSDYYNLSPRLFLNSDDVSKKLDTQYLLSYSNKTNYIGKEFSTSDIYSTLSNFEKYHDDDIFDYGFYASTEPFTTTYMFDITRLPSNSTVTISGDSVYDYSITDNSTGDTSTIYQYITNNYEYPDKPNDGSGSGSGSGGSVGGHITVGGQVDVGGKVEIDVNINGGGAAGNSYDLPDMSPLDGYLDEALSQSSGIRSFLGTFFGFLPAEFTILLGIGLTVAILARILGR